MGFEERTKKIIDDLRKDLEKIFKNASESKDQVVDEVEKLIVELKKGGNKMNEEFTDFKKNNQETFDNIENGLKQAADDVKRVFRDAYNKFK